MAGESVRHQIMDAVIAALEGITSANGYSTDVAMVSESIKHWEEIDKDDFPCCFPIDADEKKEWASFGGTSDLEGNLTIIVTSMVYSTTNTTRTARTNLIRDVEKAILNDSTLAALILNIAPVRVVTDRGTIPNYSVFDQEFLITYRYGSSAGG